jgi:hypothetical protein
MEDGGGTPPGGGGNNVSVTISVNVSPVKIGDMVIIKAGPV